MLKITPQTYENRKSCAGNSINPGAAALHPPAPSPAAALAAAPAPSLVTTLATGAGAGTLTAAAPEPSPATTLALPLHKTWHLRGKTIKRPIDAGKMAK